MKSPTKTLITAAACVPLLALTSISAAADEAAVVDADVTTATVAEVELGQGESISLEAVEASGDLTADASGSQDEVEVTRIVKTAQYTMTRTTRANCSTQTTVYDPWTTGHRAYATVSHYRSKGCSAKTYLVGISRQEWGIWGMMRSRRLKVSPGQTNYLTINYPCKGSTKTSWRTVLTDGYGTDYEKSKIVQLACSA